MEVVTQVATDCELEWNRAKGEPLRLPSQYNEYGVVVDVLKDSGTLGYLNGEVLIRRAGSFELVDVVLFLFCFFSAVSRDTSIADFAQISKQYGNELAALGGRARWPSQGSVSRALGVVSVEGARDVTRHLFALSRQAVLASKLCSSTGYRDGSGASWLVLHWDSTADTVRKRALPEGDDLPPGHRLSAELAEPGYPGRKRGEGVFARSIVSDATSSIWIHMDLGSGSGSVTDQMTRAVDDTLAYVDASPEALGRTVMVCDGVSGGTPQTRAVLNGGMHVLTRISSYKFLETAKAKKLIEKSHWLPVEDSRSGPRREAIDLGTHRVDGHQLRIIASRFPVANSRKKGRGAGTTIDGYHYELFHSSLPVAGWAANDLVTLYYGRTAIENRFAAEDHEFDLSRVFSFSEGGQLLASAIAMTLWNLRVVAGIASVSETTPERPVRARPSIVQMTTTVEEDVTTDVVHADTDETEVVDDMGAVDQTGPAEETSVSADEETLVREQVERFLKRHPEWSGDANALECPAGVALTRSVREREAGLVARFRAPSTACTDCPRRPLCTTSTAEQFRKEVAFQFGPQDSHNVATPTLKPMMEPLSAQPPPPPFLPDAPTLLPAVLRRAASKLFATTYLTVLAPPLEKPDPSDEHIAFEIASRQRRRQSIAQRVAANARPVDRPAAATIHGPANFVTMFARLKSACRSA